MSETIVLKFGGTSVGSAARVRIAARRVRAHVRRGRRVVVVVSAAARRRTGSWPSGGDWSKTAWRRQTRRRQGTRHRAWRDSAPHGSGDGTSAGDRPRPCHGRDRSAAPAAALCARHAARCCAAPRPVCWSRATSADDRRRGHGAAPAPARARRRPLGERVPGRRRRDAHSRARRVGYQRRRHRRGVWRECHIVTDVDAVYDRDPAESGRAPLRGARLRVLLALVGRREVVHPAAARIAARSGVPPGLPLRAPAARTDRPGARRRAGARGRGTRTNPRRRPMRQPAPSPPGRLLRLECGTSEDIEQAYTLTGELNVARQLRRRVPFPTRTPIRSAGGATSSGPAVRSTRPVRVLRQPSRLLLRHDPSAGALW